MANQLLNKKTKRPGARGTFPVPRDFSPEGKRFAQHIIDSLQQITGEKGNPLDKAVTFNDLINSGIVKNNLVLTSGGSASVGFTGGNDLDVDTPSIPTSVAASGAFQNITITYDRPTYAGHSHTEIWVNTTDTFGTKTFLGQTTSTIFSHQVGNGATRYYWVRHVNKNNVAGSFQDDNGVTASTSIDVGSLMNDLSEDLSDLPGYTTLTGLISDGMEVIRSATEPTTRSGGGAIKIDDVWIDTDDGQIYLRNAANNAWVASRDAQLVTDVSNLTTTVNNNTASISTNATAISTETSARTTAINNLTATVNTKNKSFVSASAPADNASNDLREGDLWIDSDDDNKLYRWNDTSSTWVEVRDTSNDGKATIFTQDNVPTSGVKAGDLWFDTNDSNKQYRAMADGSDQVTAGEWEEVRDVTTQASVTTVQNAVANGDGANAGYGVSVNANGAIAGMYIMADSSGNLQDNSSDTNIIFEADQLAVRSSTSGGENADGGTGNVYTPFLVRTTPGTINGVTVPAGVYIKAGWIQNASIEAAKIGSLSADLVNAVDINANSIVAGSISSDLLNIDGVTLDTNADGDLIIGAGGVGNVQLGNISATKITSDQLDSARINVDTLNVKHFDNVSTDIKSHTGSFVPLGVFGSTFQRASTNFTTQTQTTGTYLQMSISQVRNNAKYQAIWSGVYGDCTSGYLEYSVDNTNWTQAAGGIQNVTFAAGTFRTYVFAYSGTITGLGASADTVYWRVRWVTKLRTTYQSLYVFIDNTQ